MNRIKVGIVGCGFVAQKRHIPSFIKLKKLVSLSAVCDLNEQLAKSVASDFGSPNAYSSVSEMLSKENLDVVDVCTPPRVHTAVAIEAMKDGCHVLLEKPMASSVSDCDEMIQAATENRVKLSIVHNQAFYPPFLRAKQLVEMGAIGELTGLRVIMLTKRDEYMAHENHWIHKLPGGVIGETGPHAVYMALAFLKNVKNVEVLVKKITKYPWALYDDYRIELEAENINGSLYVSHASDYTAAEIDVFGTNCALNVDLQSMILTRRRRRHLEPVGVALSSLSTARQTVEGVILNSVKVGLRRPMLGHDIMIERFVKSIIEGHPVPVSPEEGRETVRIMEVIVEKLAQKYGKRRALLMS